MKYLEYFGMKEEPFSKTLSSKDLMELPSMLELKNRMDYLLRSGGVMAITGDVGSGKSTSLRWCIDQYHPSEVKAIYIVADTGSLSDLYKQICWELHIKILSSNKTSLLKQFKNHLREHMKKNKSKLIIIIDEASLLRTDLLAELHTLTQFNFDSVNMFSLVLAGQNSLIDKLRYSICEPLASRIMTRGHFIALSRGQMIDYLQHHLKIVGIKNQLFQEEAITGIHQGSGGLLRRANLIARGSLIACMIDKENQVTDEHVRRAASDLI
jgi:type II secretory pathway predicted ATPase ExeA